MKRIKTVDNFQTPNEEINSTGRSRARRENIEHPTTGICRGDHP